MVNRSKVVWGGKASAASVVSGFSRTMLLATVTLTLLPGKAVWAQTPRARLSQSLQQHVASKSRAGVDVIVHGTAAQMDALAARRGLTIRKRLDDGAVFRANAAQIDALSRESVDYLSRDVEVTSFMAVTDPAIGADQVWAGVAGLPGITGKGIGIAVIDSGIWAEHSALSGRVVFAKDFVDDGNGTADKYGHGTHIAGIIAGNSPYPQDSLRQTPFRGVAPEANLISLRVIDANGVGSSSDVIRAISWAIQNKARFNIRVINLSLGHAVEESYKDDPLCQAVERAVHAGIVVVAAAGNQGKDAAGRSQFGMIESPGNDPYAITVGALNTHNTPARSDDELTTYSSKGPTAIDRLVKPDVAAPGNKIVSAEALGSALAAEAGVHSLGRDADAYATLSGTSMSAAVVSGAAALVLGSNAKLTPAQVKMALQYSATFMPEVGLFGAGAGSLNTAAAVQVAHDGPTKNLPQTAISGELVTASGRVIATGAEQSARFVSSNRLIWGDQFLWGDRLIWGDQFLWGDRLIWGDQFLWGDRLIWGD